MPRAFIRRICTFFLLSLAIALGSAVARAQQTDTAETPAKPAVGVPAGEAASKCVRVHIDEDRLHGVAAQDVVICPDETADPNLLRENPNWQVNMRPSYDLPKGTKVTYEYDAPSGNCIRNWSSWTETVGEGDRGEVRNMFQVVAGNFWESCAWERSYGSWNITAVTPTGVTKKANIRIMTGLPNIYSHYAEMQCHFPQGLGCAGGSDTQMVKLGKVPTPPLRLGPIDEPSPPRAPELICTGTAHLSIGKPMNNNHPCTIEGNPRPKVEVSGLPAGITLTRWPSENDTWLVLNGTMNRSHFGPVTVTARLPSGWADSKTFWLEVK